MKDLWWGIKEKTSKIWNDLTVPTSKKSIKYEQIRFNFEDKMGNQSGL